MSDKRVLSLLSLSRKAGKLVSGENACENAVKAKTAQAVIIAQDASDNTKKKFINKAEYYDVPVYLFGIKQELSKATGNDNRAIFAITDKGFADAVKKCIQ